MGRRDRLKGRFSMVFGSGTSIRADTADSNGHQLHGQQDNRGPNKPPDGTDVVGKSPEKFAGRRIEDTPIRELWNIAYEKLREEDGKLVEDYEAQLKGSVTAGLGQTLNLKQNRREWMQAILSSKMEEVNKKLEPSSFKAQAKDTMQLILNIVDSAKDYIGNAANSNPYTSIAWTGLLMNMSAEKASLAKGLEYITSLIIQSRMREVLYVECYESGTHSHDRFRQSHTQYKTALEKLYIYILRFQATACCHYSKNSALRHALDAVKWKNWAPLVDEVREQDRNFAAVQEMWRDIQRYEKHLTKINTFSEMNAKLSALADHDFADLLKWLCDVDPSPMYNGGLDRREAGTCEWLIKDSEEFKTWETSDGSLLWLHGKAGSGKSILSSSVIKYLWDQYVSELSTVVSYFYFSFSDPEKQNVDVMLASLTKQICARQTQRSQLMERLGQYKISGQRPDTETLEAVLIASASEFANIYVVIDALDECPLLNEQRAKLLKSLRRILAIAPNKFHFFFTSRKEPDIDDKIRPILSSTNKNEIDLLARQQTINRDIIHYIDSQLNGDEYKSWPKSVKEEARESLVKKADCMFQYVRLQLEALRHLSSEPEVREALQNLPTGLDATYNRVLESIPPHVQERVIHSLKWLAFSREVLCIEELAEIFIIRPHNDVPFDEAERPFSPADTLKYFSGLVITQKGWDYRRHRITQITQITQIRLVHFSLKEYLISMRITQGPTLAFSFTEINAQLSIVQSCFAYLNHLNHWVASHAAKCLDARYGHAELTKMLIYQKSGANKYVTREELDEALQEMAVKGGTDMMQLFLEAGADVNAQCGRWGSALQAAARFRHLNALKFLVGHGANVHCFSNGDECLLTCIDEGGTDCLKFLLDSGADINRQNEQGQTALHKAVVGGFGAVFDLLLERGANINALAASGTPLQAACMALPSQFSFGKRLRENARIVKKLLERGADPNHRVGKIGTALQLACENRGLFPNRQVAMEILQLLVENGTVERGTIINGFVVDEVDEDGPFWKSLKEERKWDTRRPIHPSAVEVVKLLLENGARIDDGPLALHMACLEWDEEKVRRLLDQGADANAKSDSFGTPLHAILTYYIYEGEVKKYFRDFNSSKNPSKEIVPIVQLLISRGARINEIGGIHGTALQAACCNHAFDAEMVRFLIEQKADVNATGGKYGTALMAACRNKNPKLVRLLLEYGANIHHQDDAVWNAAPGWSPWRWNVDDIIEVLELLCNQETDIHRLNRGLTTALNATLEIRSLDFVEEKQTLRERICWLLEHGADINAKGGKYGFALQTACAREEDSAWPFDYSDINANCGTTKILLEQCPNINVNAQGGIFGSALQAAAFSGQTESIRLLLDRGADVNARGGKCGSALNAAIFRGYWDIVEILLQKGATPDHHLQQQPDEEWLRRVEEEWLQDIDEEWLQDIYEEWRIHAGKAERRCAIPRYRKFWEVESGSAAGAG
ncbi:hypothetical protein THARTR1_01781 [Trichoderma harzianum]|uniref:Uncharacterized protein n=1 Tax=Trichoderma harzianum TaxID=5544 RepID=A0A2K0UKK7_TRIHA|nr:hypothetical protein THARTR1_01781 [Trichoderma harzianum]